MSSEDPIWNESFHVLPEDFQFPCSDIVFASSLVALCEDDEKSTSSNEFMLFLKISKSVFKALLQSFNSACRVRNRVFVSADFLGFTLHWMNSMMRQM